MKRVSVIKYKSVHAFLTIFKWLKCDKCGLEFRREKGYMKRIYPFPNSISKMSYLCEDCAPYSYRAEQIFDEIERLNKYDRTKM